MIEWREDRGYNPHRSKDGRFASGSGSGAGKRKVAPKFNAAPHQRKIAALKNQEVKHRRASIALKSQMAALKKTARAAPPKKRPALQKRWEKLAARRVALQAKSETAKASRLEAVQSMRFARAEHVAKQKAAREAARGQSKPTPAIALVQPAASVDAPPVVWEKKKNPRRVEAAKKAAEASVERRREIHSAVASNLPQELQTAWSKEGHKFMQQEADRIRGEKDRINAASKISEAFAEKYGSGNESAHGNEGDRYHRRAEIEARHAESWADEQERNYYAAAMREEQYHRSAPTVIDDDDVPF